MSSPRPASAGPSRPESPPPSQPSPASPEKEHVTENQTPTQYEPAPLPSQPVPPQFHWQQRPHLAQLVHPQPIPQPSSSPLVRQHQQQPQFSSLTQPQQPPWSPLSPPSPAQHNAMFVPHQWNQPVYAQFHPNAFSSLPPHPHFHQQPSGSQHVSQFQHAPNQQGWTNQPPLVQPLRDYSPYGGLPAKEQPSGVQYDRHPQQTYPSSDVRTEGIQMRSSYPPAAELSPARTSQAGSPVSEGSTGGKRKPAGSPLEGQVNHPTFTPINPNGESQSPASASPTANKKAKVSVDKVERVESYYDVPSLANCTPFVNKLKYMLDTPHEFGEVVRWDSSGTRVLVKQGSSRLANDFLPRLFSHSKVDNFNRQFSSYKFTRIQNAAMIPLVPPGTLATDWKGWQQANFTVASTNAQLASLSPKAYTKKTDPPAASPAPAPSSAPTAAFLTNPLVQLGSVQRAVASSSAQSDIPVFPPTVTPTDLPVAPGPVGFARSQPRSGGGGTPEVVRVERPSTAELASLRSTAAEAGPAGDEAAGEEQVSQARAQAQEESLPWNDDGAAFVHGEQMEPWGARLASDEWDGGQQDPQGQEEPGHDQA